MGSWLRNAAAATAATLNSSIRSPWLITVVLALATKKRSHG